MSDSALSWAYTTEFPWPELAAISPSVVVEFCDRCRWLHRAQWVATELFLTFPPPAIKSITTIPLNSEETGGRFRVWLIQEGKCTCCWDRKLEGGFPELKQLKQRIRDCIAPNQSLGHSDKKPHAPKDSSVTEHQPEVDSIIEDPSAPACEL